MTVSLQAIFPIPKPIIAMVHLRPLPGSPLYSRAERDFAKVLAIAVEEAKILEDAGVDGLQVENIWDYPYQKGDEIGHETTAALAVATAKVREAVSIPVGVNCHLNGAEPALAAAVMGGARWIRVFEYVNAYISQVGYVDSVAARLARYRKALEATDVMFMCDVNVKHGSHFIISDRPVFEQARDAEIQGADALIVTGFETGTPPNAENIAQCKKGVTLPVLLGSGITRENARELLAIADGAIVGSYFKKDNDWKKPVEASRARAFMEAMRAVRG
ncbi:MAG: BtpA/SgcQ family protein [Planctomycetaceae bacterium]|nr:BtpA/SgcQ family protein [Planctomycetaceae bacterium]